MENPQPVTTERIFHAYLKVARVAESTKDISLAKIAEELGVSRQAIYKNHFQNIEELTQSLHYYVDNKPYQQLKCFVLHDQNHSFKDLLTFFAEDIIPTLYEKHEFLGVFYSKVADSAWRPYLNQQYIDMLTPYFDNAKGYRHELTAQTLAELTINQAMAVISIWLAQDEPVEPGIFAKRFIYLFSNSILDLAKTSD